MRAHVLDENGLILNTIKVATLDEGQVDADLLGGGPGDSIIDGVLVRKTAGSSPPPRPPAIVTMRQARLALFDAGLLDAVPQMIAAIPEEDHRQRAQIEWDSANDVERNNQFTAFLAASLGLSDAELDDLFRMAATK